MMSTKQKSEIWGSPPRSRDSSSSSTHLPRAWNSSLTLSSATTSATHGSSRRMLQSLPVLLFTCLFLLLTAAVDAFNLEPTLPVIKKSEPGSYFGFSVAQHLTEQQQPWILVGAPLGQNLQPFTNRSGALFKCPLTGLETDCRQVVTDGKRDANGFYDRFRDSNHLSGPLDQELKDGQWLGVNVKSQGQGGKVMVCAHRYIHKGRDFRWALGLCHFLTQSLEYDQTLEPCRGKQKLGLEDYGYCQAGTSGWLSKDYTAVMGAPGSYTCRGTIHGISVSDNFLTKDRNQYHSPLFEDNPVNKYSYLGWSVTGGYFFGDDKMVFVSGAPRAANGSGQVIFFSKSVSERLTVEAILTGEGFAFSYGYELTTLDINGDKKPDLVVGAPFYADDKGHGGAAYIYLNDHHKNGNTSHKAFQNSNNFVRLIGPSFSRFGLALTSLGDLNKDGFDDLAIGAPYDGRGAVYVYLGSNEGIIREPSQVIRASAHFPTMQTFGYSLSGGMDLDKNSYPDLLVGAYDSSTVVLLRSRPIIDILAEVSGNLTGIDPAQRGCDADPTSEQVCFEIEACFEIRELTQVRADSLTVICTLEAETFIQGRKFSRVEFNSSRDFERSQIVQIEKNVRRNDLGKECWREIVYVKEHTKDIQTPIPFKLTYTLKQRIPRYIANVTTLPTIQNYPILNQQEASKIFHAHFEKDCGDNELCESDLFLKATTDLQLEPGTGNYLFLLGKKELILNISIGNFGEPAYEAYLFIAHPQSVQYKARGAEGAVFDCSPHNITLVICQLGNPYKKSRSPDPFHEFSLRFDALGLKDIETRLDFQLWANSTSLETDEQNDHVNVSVTVVKVAELLITGRSEPTKIAYTGPVKGESATRNIVDIGPKVTHVYEIYNNGPWKASHFNIIIYWPHQVGNNHSYPEGKWLLYPDKQPDVQGDGQCVVSEDLINVLNLSHPLASNEPNLPTSDIIESSSGSFTPDHVHVEKSDLRGRRTKRSSSLSTETVVSPDIEYDSEGNKRKIVKMDCTRGSAMCFRINCVIKNLLPLESAVIKIHSRLWSSTLVEDYPHIDEVRVYSKAQIEITDDNRPVPGTDTAHAVTICEPDLKLKAKYDGVDWWVYVLAILVGIFLLALIVYCLHKYGFFKRRRPQPTHTAAIIKS